MREQRNLLVDCIKGGAIFLVVLGHCIQFMGPSSYNFFDNFIFKSIYSFHMPLFMAVSGYLFSVTIKKRNMCENIINKFHKLIIPAISWTILISLLFNGSVSVQDIKYQLISGLWFITTLFIISTVAYTIFSISHKNFILLYALFCIAILFAPDGYNIKMIKFLAPFFGLGMLFDYILKVTKPLQGNLTFLTILFIWVYLVINWKESYYIYTSGMSMDINNWQEQSINNIYRFISGLIGIYIAVFVFYMISKNTLLLNSLSLLGKHTLSIYIIQTFIFYWISKLDVINVYSNEYTYSLVIAPLFSIVIIAFCILISIILQKVHLANIILLGGEGNIRCKS
ncbi:TPA: acyltransferase family protein [Escherichia coli]